jgi:hypothetical protein
MPPQSTEHANDLMFSAHEDKRFSMMVAATSYISPFEVFEEVQRKLIDLSIEGVIVFDLILTGNSRTQRYFSAPFFNGDFGGVCAVTGQDELQLHSKFSAKMMAENFHLLNTRLLSKAQVYALKQGIEFQYQGPGAEQNHFNEKDISIVDGHQHLDDDFVVIPETGITIADYLHGRCDVFAIALARNTGMKVGAIIQGEPMDGGDPFLVHAFCLHPTQEDAVMDAKGIRLRSEIYDEYGESERFSDFVVGTAEEMSKIIFDITHVRPEGGAHERSRLDRLIQELLKIDLYEMSTSAS